jgi:hypothetical protein
VEPGVYTLRHGGHKTHTGSDQRPTLRPTEVRRERLLDPAHPGICRVHLRTILRQRMGRDAVLEPGLLDARPSWTVAFSCASSGRVNRVPGCPRNAGCDPASPCVVKRRTQSSTVPRLRPGCRAPCLAG